MSKLTLTITLISLLFLGGCSLTDKTSSSTSTTASTREEPAVLAYQQEVSNLTELSTKEFQDKLTDSNTFLVYIGKATCHSCQTFLPQLTAAMGNQTIYYYDVAEADRQPAIKELLVSLDLEYVPALLRLSDSGNTITAFDHKQDDLNAFLEN